MSIRADRPIEILLVEDVRLYERRGSLRTRSSSTRAGTGAPRRCSPRALRSPRWPGTWATPWRLLAASTRTGSGTIGTCRPPFSTGCSHLGTRYGRVMGRRMQGRDVLRRRSGAVGDGEPACKPDCVTALRRGMCERSFPRLTREPALGGAHRLAPVRQLARHVRVTTGPARPGRRRLCRRASRAIPRPAAAGRLDRVQRVFTASGISSWRLPARLTKGSTVG
jgi:hypothetical protein